MLSSDLRMSSVSAEEDRLIMKMGRPKAPATHMTREVLPVPARAEGGEELNLRSLKAYLRTIIHNVYFKLCDNEFQQVQVSARAPNFASNNSAL